MTILKRLFACVSFAFAVFAADAMTLHWEGTSIQAAGISTSPTEWQMTLLDPAKVSRDVVSAALVANDYAKLSESLGLGKVYSTTGCVYATSGNGYWNVQEAPMPSEYESNTSFTFYTLILDHSLSSSKSGHYILTNLKTTPVMGAQCEMGFGSFATNTWSRYPNQVFLEWTGERGMFSEESYTNAAVWGVNLMDAKKVSPAALRSAFSTGDYATLCAAVEKGRVASTVGLKAGESADFAWAYSAALPEEYVDDKYFETNSLSLYTLIFSPALTNGVGRYAVTDVLKGHYTAGSNVCSVAFKSAVELAWTDYSYGTVGGDDSDEPATTNQVMLYWTSSKVALQGSLSTNVNEWTICLMDSKVVAPDTLRTALGTGDYDQIAAVLEEGAVASTTGLLANASQAYWDYEGLMPAEYSSKAYWGAHSLSLYTVVLTQSYANPTNKLGMYMYLMSDVKSGCIEDSYADDLDGECSFLFGDLTSLSWASYEVTTYKETPVPEPEPIDPALTNQVMLAWTGSNVLFTTTSTTNVNAWQIYLMDARKASPAVVQNALEFQDYTKVAEVIDKGCVATTTGIVETAKSGGWAYEGLMSTNYTVSTCSETNALNFYTLIFNKSLPRKSGKYTMTDSLVGSITNANEVCEMNFGSLTNLTWADYKLVTGWDADKKAEALPFPEKEDGTVQYNWTGMNIPAIKGGSTNATNWQIILMDAAKVATNEMVAAFASTNYYTIYAALTNGFVSTTTGQVSRLETKDVNRWWKDGYLPKEYVQSQYREGGSLNFYTVILDSTLSLASGKYLMTETISANTPDVGLCVLAFGSISNATWSAYTIPEDTSDDDDDDDVAIGSVELDWSGSNITLAGSKEDSEEADVGDWKVFLMDAAKVSTDEMMAAFSSKSLTNVVTTILKGKIAITEAKSGTTASWSSSELYLPDDYDVEEYRTNSLSCYTLILNHSLAENQSGRYLLSRTIARKVTRKKVTGQDEMDTCKFNFGSLYSCNWRVYSLTSSSAAEGSEDEDSDILEVELNWSGSKVSSITGQTEPSEWEIILMDSAKVSTDAIKAAFKDVNYTKIARLIDKGRVVSKVGLSTSGTNQVDWSYSETLPEEYVTSANCAAKSMKFYTLILNHSLEEGESGRYFLTRVISSNIAASTEIGEDGEETSYSCEMAFGSQAAIGSRSAWYTYKSLVAKEDDEDEDEEESEVPVLDFSTAQVYNGYLAYGESGIAGTIQVKAARQKVDRKTKATTSKLTIYIQVLGEKKITLSGTMNLAEAEISLTTKDERDLELTLTMDEMSGFFDGYDIIGMRDIFSSKTAADKALAADATTLWKSALTMVWEKEDSDGYNRLSFIASTKGKVKVSGTVGGQTVSTTAQILVDAEGDTILPIAYTKKTVTLALVVKRSLDGEVTVDHDFMEEPVIGSPTSFEETAFFSLADVDTMSEYAGDTAFAYSAYLPTSVEITQSGTKWVLPKAGKVVLKNGVIDESRLLDNPSGLRLAYRVKDGTFSGSFKAYYEYRGKPKAVTVSVVGVMVDGVGYGTATIRNKGSVPVLIQ